MKPSSHSRPTRLKSTTVIAVVILAIAVTMVAYFASNPTSNEGTIQSQSRQMTSHSRSRMNR